MNAQDVAGMTPWHIYIHGYYILKSTYAMYYVFFRFPFSSLVDFPDAF